LQFVYLIGIIDILFPGVNFCETCLGNDACIDGCGCLNIQSGNGFSLCHVFSLFPEGTTACVERKHPHPVSAKTPQVSLDEPGDKYSGVELAIADQLLTRPEPVRVVVEDALPSRRYRVPCPGYLRSL